MFRMCSSCCHWWLADCLTNEVFEIFWWNFFVVLSKMYIKRPCLYWPAEVVAVTRWFDHFNFPLMWRNKAEYISMLLHPICNDKILGFWTKSINVGFSLISISRSEIRLQWPIIHHKINFLTYFRKFRL